MNQVILFLHSLLASEETALVETQTLTDEDCLVALDDATMWEESQFAEDINCKSDDSEGHINQQTLTPRVN